MQETRCRELEAKISVLEDENERLAERAEEILLLGLVGESVSHLDEAKDVLENVLERISVLKDIPYCACCALSGESAQIVSVYAAFRDDNFDTDHVQLSLPLLRELEQGVSVVQGVEKGEREISISLHGADFSPHTVAVVPFVTRTLPKGVFVFADDEFTEDRLSPMLPLLQRTVDMTAARLDNISLVDELKQLNTELDQRVAQRTRALEQSNEDLRESEAQYRSLFHDMPIGLYRSKSGTQFIAVNQALADMLGYPDCESLLATATTALFATPEDRQRLVLAERGDGARSLELQLRRQDGTPIWVTCHSHVARDDQGQALYYEGALQAVTERKRAEESLRKLSHAVEQSPASVIITDTAGRIEYVNPKFTQLTGYTLDEVLGQNPSLLKSGHTPPEEYKQLWETVASGGEWRGEFLNKKKNGELYWEMASISPVRDAKGTITHFVAVKEDITERKRAEEALRENEAHYRAIVEAFDGLIYICSQDYRVEFMNKQLIERTGYDGTGELCYKVLHERDTICSWCVNPHVFRGETVRWEVQSPKDNRWYYVVDTPIHHPDGSISKQAMILDITERKRVQSIMQARLRLLEFASSHSMGELLTATLDEIEALTGSTIGFYHFLETDQKTLFLQNWSTNTLKNMCTAEGKGSHYDIAQAGVWVDCVRERRPVIHNDYVSLPHRKGLPEGHAPVIREVVVPIFRGNLIKAILGVGNKSTPYTENDIEIVSQLGDLSWDIAERKRAEEALKGQYSTLRGIINSANALIFSVDRQYRYTSFNQGHAAVMQALYGAEIKIGHSLLEYMTVAEDRETAKRNLDRALGGEQLVEEAYSGEEPRSRRYFQVSHSPIKTETGEIIGVAVLAQDLTERKRTEEALQESEKQFRLLAENSTDLISLHSPDGIYLYASPACKTLLGYKPDELVGHSAYEFFHPADAAAVRQSHTTIIEQPVVYTVPYRIRRKDGDYIWFETTSRTIRDTETGAVIEIQAASRDITARRQAEEAEQRRRRIAETLVKAVAVLNSTLDLDQVLDLILQQLHQAIDYNSASFLEIESDHLVISAYQGFRKPNDVLGARFSLDPGLPTHRVVTEKAPLHLADVGQEYPHFLDRESTDPSYHIHTWLGVPVLSKDRMIGVITLDRLEVRPFTNEDIELAGAFANQAAIAIENAQLHEQTQRHAEELEQRVEERTTDLQQEILERKRAEAALAYERDLLQIIMDSSPDFIFFKDRDSNFIRTNRASALFLNCIDPQEVVGKNDFDFFPREDAQRFYDEEQHIMQSGQPTIAREWTVPDQQGGRIWLSEHKLPLRNEAGQVVGLLGISRDITERKRAEEALRESEERLQSTLASMDDLVFVLDQDGVFLDYYQPRSIPDLYTPPEVLLGKSFKVVLPPHVIELLENAIKSVVATNSVQQFDYPLTVVDEEQWFSAKVSMRKDLTGGFAGVTVVARNITQRKRSERVIQERTMQLEAANEDLRILSRVKDEFVSNVSHELRTPITNLKLRHHLLAARPDRWEGHLAVLSRETKRLEQIIESLLFLSRLDQARVDWNPTQVDLNQLVAQFVRDRMALAQSGELSLSFTGEPNLPLVEADVALWEQALSILLTNAFNYTPAGGHVEVRTQVHEREEQRWVGVSVSDTGPGIFPDEQSHLFERFFRGTTGRESGTPGTGLGLSIVQEIVNKHRGRVEVFSEGVPGKGSTFSLWLLAAGSADEKQQTPGEQST